MLSRKFHNLEKHQIDEIYEATNNNNVESLKKTNNYNAIFNSVVDINGDFFVERGQLVRKNGINWVIAAFFIVADMAGGGIVALPTAFVRCSMSIGLFLVLFLATLATSSAIFLGKAWVILLRRYPIYRTHCRKPYAEMGFRAFGPKMKTIVSISLNVTQFGASTVFLLLIAKNSDDFLRATFDINVGICLMIVIVGLLLLPITLFKSPQDFWPVVVLGMVSTAIAVGLVCIGATLDYKCFKESHIPDPNFANILIALGTIMFTFGGHSALPTIQHDMRKPFEFQKSSILAFSIITGLNLIAVIFGALTYGDSLRSSVINSIQTPWIQQSINLMILAHCLLTFTLIINPLNQDAEEYFSISQEFCWQRIIVRVGMMTAAMLMATTVPTFDFILSLIGGLAFTLISMIFPCVFYLCLAADEMKAKEIELCEPKMDFYHEYSSMSFLEIYKRTRFDVILLCGTVCLVGALFGLIATITSIASIFLQTSDHFVKPCYINWFSNNTDPTPTSQFLSVLNCCGDFQNISLTGIKCTLPDYKFYTPQINFFD